MPAEDAHCLGYRLAFSRPEFPVQGRGVAPAPCLKVLRNTLLGFALWARFVCSYEVRHDAGDVRLLASALLENLPLLLRSG